MNDKKSATRPKNGWRSYYAFSKAGGWSTLHAACLADAHALALARGHKEPSLFTLKKTSKGGQGRVWDLAASYARGRFEIARKGKDSPEVNLAERFPPEKGARTSGFGYAAPWYFFARGKWSVVAEKTYKDALARIQNFHQGHSGSLDLAEVSIYRAKPGRAFHGNRADAAAHAAFIQKLFDEGRLRAVRTGKHVPAKSPPKPTPFLDSLAKATEAAAKQANETVANLPPAGAEKGVVRLWERVAKLEKTVMQHQAALNALCSRGSK